MNSWSAGMQRISAQHTRGVKKNLLQDASKKQTKQESESEGASALQRKPLIVNEGTLSWNDVWTNRLTKGSLQKAKSILLQGVAAISGLIYSQGRSNQEKVIFTVLTFMAATWEAVVKGLFHPTTKKNSPPVEHRFPTSLL